MSYSYQYISSLVGLVVALLIQAVAVSVVAVSVVDNVS